LQKAEQRQTTHMCESIGNNLTPVPKVLVLH
jgi:hypothetical protein